MISFNDAVAIILKGRPERKVVSASLADALGQVCAADLLANLTQPPFSASAMDGYAVPFNAPIETGHRFEIIGESPAGSPYAGKVKTGQAVRLFTGSVIPGGAGHVVIQEDVTRDGNYITIDEAQPIARNIRKAGIDFKRDEVLIMRGTKITPAHIALAAAGNHARIEIYRPLNVALLAGGDELVSPGAEVGPGQIVSSNQAGLSALLRSWGMTVTDLGIAKDDPADIAARVQSAQDVDVIIPIGGASVGDHDHMRAVFKSLGYETQFEKAAIRPGKPTWFASKPHRDGQAQCVLGLPGNPASAYVCAHLFLPLLLGLKHKVETISLPLSMDIKANGPRDHFQRARVNRAGNALSVTPFAKTDSSLITPLVEANALIHLPAGAGPWKDGDLVQLLPLYDADL